MTLLTFVLIFLCVGAFSHTERSLRMKKIIETALTHSGIGKEKAARHQELDEAQFRRQLEGEGGNTPSIYRLANMPNEWHVKRIQLEAPHYGLVVLPANQIGAAVELFVRIMGRHSRMAKAALPAEKKQESA